MLNKISIEYTASHRPTSAVHTHRTDDSVEAEDFIMQLLTCGAKIQAIKHEGVDLSQHQFDRMLKVASERLAAQRLHDCLDIDPAEIKHRFGFAV